MRQQDGLEEQDNGAEDAHFERAKQDRAQPGAGGVAAGTGDTGDFERAQNKSKGPSHAKQQAGFGLFGYGAPDADVINTSASTSQRAPNRFFRFMLSPLYL